MRLTREIKIAATVIVAAVLLYFGMNFLKGQTIGSNNTYKMSFTDLKGLTRTTAIFANGYKVGTISDIQYDYENVGEAITVLADIDPRLRIPVGTKAKIETDLMGNMKVSLIMGKAAAQRLKPGDVIEGVEDLGMMQQVNAMMPAVQAMVPKLDSILTRLNTILASPAIISMLQNLDGMTASLKFTSEELNFIMKELHSGMPAIVAHANNTLANTETMTAKLNDIDFNSTMTKIDNTLSNVESLTKTLNSTEGSLGLLLHDKTMYNNLSATLADADSLMIDLKAHPKRYVHFSVFGKKDKK